MAHKKNLEPKCKRCGKCCYYVTKEKTWALCPYAVVDTRGYTTCPRFHKRIGTILPNGQICGFRKDYRYNIPNCPYNKKGMTKHPYFNKE